MAEQAPWEEEAPPWEPEKAPWASSAFEAAVETILGHEGGYANDPDDRGGETKFGISKRAYPHLDIRNLTRDAAVEIYRRDYWEALGADSLPPELQEVAFDAAVNQGVGWTKQALEGADVETFIERRRQRYEAIIENDPSQAKYKQGWMRRLSSYAPPWMNDKGES